MAANSPLQGQFRIFLHDIIGSIFDFYLLKGLDIICIACTMKAGNEGPLEENEH